MVLFCTFTVPLQKIHQSFSILTKLPNICKQSAKSVVCCYISYIIVIFSWVFSDLIPIVFNICS